MADKVQLIKEEIERRLQSINEMIGISKTDFGIGIFDTLNALKQFIDSLPEEPASEDLEEEISNYIKDNFFGSKSMGFLSNRTKGELDSIDVVNTAHHFAEWGRNHFEDKSEMVSEDLEEVAYNYAQQHNELLGFDLDQNLKKAVIFGAEWQKKKDKQLVGATQKISHQHGYDEGRLDMKEEMMKDAVHAWVNTYESVTNPYDNQVSFITNLSPSKFRNKETAQIIIVISKHCKGD